MAQERLTMRKIGEVLRLKWECGLSNRAIARSRSISRSTVGECLRHAQEAGLSQAYYLEFKGRRIGKRCRPDA